jgi:hypothetical protein
MKRTQMTTLTNTGKNPRNVYYSKTKSVHLLPGQSKTVPMLQEDIAARVASGGPIVVDNDAAVRAISDIDESDAGGNDGSGDKDKGETGKTLDEVIAMASDKSVEFPIFIAAAKDVLGESYPSGNTKKRDIVAALEAKKNED